MPFYYNFERTKSWEMLLIYRPETDPFFNIAAEEFILKNYSREIFMAWRNDPCIVVGKHQNTVREINHEFVRKHRLPVIRRISGGGTVYHDLGNINFSFILMGRKENPIDFRQFTLPVIRFLATLGIEASLEGKSNLVARGLKISGNSAHVFRDKVLYHGTLLFETDLDSLENAVSGNETHYLDRAVRSNRAKTGNISSLIGHPISAVEFIDAFYDFVKDKDNQPDIHYFSFEEKNAICRLAMEKYHQWSWNYGYSPEYQFQKDFQTGKYRGKILIKVAGGKIDRLKIVGSDLPASWTSKAEALLAGLPHDPAILNGKIQESVFASAEEQEFLNQIALQMF